MDYGVSSIIWVIVVSDVSRCLPVLVRLLILCGISYLADNHCTFSVQTESFLFMTSFIFKQNTKRSLPPTTTNHQHDHTTTAITEIRDRKNILPTKIAIEFCFTEEKYNSWLAVAQYLRVRLALSLVWPALLSDHQLLDVTEDSWLVTGGGHMPIFHHYDRSLDCYHNYTTMQYQNWPNYM